MIRKRKIIKGIDQQIINLSCSITDYQLENDDLFKPVIFDLKTKRSELIEIKTRLEKILL
jgi:hypothetical protein